MGSSQQLPISDQIFDDLSPVYDDSVKLRVNSNNLKTVIARIFDLKNILKPHFSLQLQVFCSKLDFSCFNVLLSVVTLIDNLQQQPIVLKNWTQLL